jgi:hypothetical protein
MNPITLKPNEPVILSLRECSGILDGFHVLYETSDGKILQLPRPAAVKLNELEPLPGEEFSVIKHQVGKEPAEFVFTLTPTSEKIRAAKEAEAVAAELARQTRADLPRQLQASVLRQMPKSARNLPATPSESPLADGTYGPVPQAAPRGGKTPPSRVSYRVALREITFAVTDLLKESGEQWNDQAKQDLVSTAFIAAAKDGTLVFDFDGDRCDRAAAPEVTA